MIVNAHFKTKRVSESLSNIPWRFRETNNLDITKFSLHDLDNTQLEENLDNKTVSRISAKNKV